MNFEHDFSNNIVAQEKQAAENFRGWFKKLMDTVTGPLPIVGGSPLPSREGLPGRAVTGVNSDKELIDKTTHVRKPKELMMQFFARVPSCGAHFIRTHSKAEIKQLVDVAMANPDYVEHEDVVVQMFEPKPPRTRVVFT